jgi:small basic protein
LAIKFAVRIVNLPSLPSNISDLIKAAVLAQFNGTNGAIRARIGAAILAANYYAPVAGAASNVQLISVLVGTSSPTDTQVDVGIDQAPTLDASDIAVILV